LLAEEGFQTVVADVTRPATLCNLPSARTVLFAVGYDRRQPQSIGEVYADGLQHVLAALPLTTQRVIYISSTGVYGDAAGDWIDENTPPDPTREGGRASLTAERVLFAHALGNRGIVLRLAGIYGPGRIPRCEDLAAGRPIASHAEGLLNLIHVDDAVQAVLAADALAKPPRIYNVSDGAPALRRTFYEELARLLNVPSPHFVPPSDGSSERSRGESDRRVRNLRMVNELDVILQYPTFREGLAAVASSELET
jgi:nucleoside-diphosphate-sugar epimerase